MIEVKQLRKTFGRYPALHGVDLKIETGELIALLGPSGSGKTTLLRLIAGLEFADPGGGEILFDGEPVSDRPVGQRGVGFVFQSYALFRHLSVFENVAFGLRVRPAKTRPKGADIKKRVNELLQLVQLGDLGKRYPAQLSGGQRQRVALARALAIDPSVLLLDEPFGALDAKVRKDLRRWLRELQKRLGLTTVFVTHDQEEALEIADRVVVMSTGRIEQIGTSQEVYDQPATPFVMEFLGDVNRFGKDAPSAERRARRPTFARTTSASSGSARGTARRRSRRSSKGWWCGGRRRGWSWHAWTTGNGSKRRSAARGRMNSSCGKRSACSSSCSSRTICRPITRSEYGLPSPSAAGMIPPFPKGTKGCRTNRKTYRAERRGRAGRKCPRRQEPFRPLRGPTGSFIRRKAPSTCFRRG